MGGWAIPLSSSRCTLTANHQPEDSSGRLREVLRGNRQCGKGGIYAVCSAHPAVIEAGVRQSMEDGSLLLVESTSSQVNQFGGYTGLTPRQFSRFVHSAASRAGLPPGRVLLGGDHVGPFPWRRETSAAALGKARVLVHDCIAAGYRKIHLDASMACADDGMGISERTVAERAAILCEAAEQACRELPPGYSHPLYVIGTEVPAPGGESDARGPVVTKAEDAHRTLEAFRLAFQERGLLSAWDRVIALVVQPGVDFGSDAIFDYDRSKARSLSAALSEHPRIVFEAHSTDYQSPKALAQMVDDHFGILKVGPWLTFAYREAVSALSAIERELFATTSDRQISRVREVLEEEMIRDPSQWQAYYRGGEDQVRRELIYGYSDRCRYYWHQPAVREEIAQLLRNLDERPIPLPLVSQYLPLEYEAIRSGELQAISERMIEHHIRRVMRVYAHACATKPVP